MTDSEIRDLLRSTLEMLKQQAVYLHRLHGWIIAVAETLEKHPDLADELRRHPTYDQGPLPWLQSIDEMLRRLDALIQKVRVQ